MGGGWFSWFSPSSPPQTTEAARPSPPAFQNAKQEQDWYRRQHLLLEKERLERLIKAEGVGEASQAAQPPLSRSLITQQPPHVEPERTPREQFTRGAKQLGLFFAGAGFLTASALIARRAVTRKMVDSLPRFYQPSHHGPKPPPRGPKEKSEDQLVAVEALGLATLNVFSFGVMMTGGLMFAFDISNVEELRRKARGSLYGTNGVVDDAAEQQVEEWIAEVLSRKDKREGEGDAQKKHD